MQGKEEHRKAAYDLLLSMSSTLRNLSYLISESDPPFHKLISMVRIILSLYMCIPLVNKLAALVCTPL